MPKVSERDVQWKEYDEGDNAFRRKELANAAGASLLGCSLYELDPGKRSWPLHYHTANEEALYVLAGRATLRTGTDGEEESVEAGDFVSLPADETGAHQLVNDGETTLRYLAVSTMNEPDVTVYPELGTFGVFAGAAPGGRGTRTVHGYYPLDADVDYWEGAPDAVDGAEPSGSVGNGTRTADGTDASTEREDE